MKKWIILAVLAVLLVAGVILTERYFGNDNGDVTQITEESTTEETYSAEDTALMELTYEEYLEMTDTEKDNFKNSFSALRIFIRWHNTAKAEYDAKQDVIVIGPGQDININDFIN